MGNTMNKINSILYVCSGNVFRSVFAEGYTKQLLVNNGIDSIKVSSCGIIAQESFKLPRSIRNLFELYKITAKNLDTHKPTRINHEILFTHDLILVMDKTQISYIKENHPEFIPKTFLLKEYAGFFTKPEIFDPIGQPESVYLQTAEEIKLCVEIIVKKLIVLNIK